VLSLFDFSFSSLAGQVLLILRLQILVACRASAFHMFDFRLPSPAGQVLFVLRVQFLVASRSSALCSSTLITMILTCLKRLWWIASQESRVLLCSKDFETARFLHCWQPIHFVHFSWTFSIVCACKIANADAIFANSKWSYLLPFADMLNSWMQVRCLAIFFSSIHRNSSLFSTSQHVRRRLRVSSY
jgi:hypothetical protein